MATAFTQREREHIHERLQNVGLRCAATIGMKRSTVDEIAREAGISKGAFYGFFASKEHLFLNILELIHNEMYGNAERIFTQRVDLPIKERAALAITEVCRVAEKREAIQFIRDEVPQLLIKLPEDVLKKHYQSDEDRIKNLVRKANVSLSTSLETACAVIRMLMMTLLLKGEVGEEYDEAMRVMIDGACDRLIRS